MKRRDFLSNLSIAIGGTIILSKVTTGTEVPKSEIPKPVIGPEPSVDHAYSEIYDYGNISIMDRDGKVLAEIPLGKSELEDGVINFNPTSAIAQAEGEVSHFNINDRNGEPLISKISVIHLNMDNEYLGEGQALLVRHIRISDNLFNLGKKPMQI